MDGGEEMISHMSDRQTLSCLVAAEEAAGGYYAKGISMHEFARL